MINKRKRIVLSLVILFFVTASFYGTILFLQGGDIDLFVVAADISQSTEINSVITNRSKTFDYLPYEQKSYNLVIPDQITPTPYVSYIAEPLISDFPESNTNDIIIPNITSEPSVFENNLVLGEFTTEFSTKLKSRCHNINKASNSINGIILKPGEEFSYNKTIGPTNKSNGYEKAGIFKKGKRAFGYGGGVCQVSTTLFNAVEIAGLEVTERHKHSLPVTYVSKGKDAAASWGNIDFKFKNTLSYSVKIASEVIENIVRVKIIPA